MMDWSISIRSNHPHDISFPLKGRKIVHFPAVPATRDRFCGMAAGQINVATRTGSLAAPSGASRGNSKGGASPLCGDGLEVMLEKQRGASRGGI